MLKYINVSYSAVVMRSIVVTDVMFQFEFAAYTNVRANDISVWYQFPQYIIITAGEVLFSVTGLSFAYTQVISCDIFLFLSLPIFVYLLYVSERIRCAC